MEERLQRRKPLLVNYLRMMTALAALPAPRPEFDPSPARGALSAEHLEVNMHDGRRPRLRWITLCSLVVTVASGAFAVAQDNQPLNLDQFITGRAAQQWQAWSTAMQAELDRQPDQAEQAFQNLLTTDPSPLRLALLADRTLKQSRQGGALILFEQDYTSDQLGDAGRTIYERLAAGQEQLNQADDAWYFASIGRFDVADANLKALLAQDPDPVAMLEFVDRVGRRHDILIQLSDNAIVGPDVARVLQLLARGEELIKADPTRIKENIRRLSGPPRAFENAVAALQQSGEYSIPFLLQALREAAGTSLVQPILRALPAIDRPGLNPLVIALKMSDDATRQVIIETLAKIGYGQATPYLLQIAQSDSEPVELREAARAALATLRSGGLQIPADATAAEAFYALAEGYYSDLPSLRADPRLDTANVWYWRDELLQNIEVPTTIFNEIMAMRCCEEALRLDPDYADALSLWLAANFRREAQLAGVKTDPTRPENFPSGEYFAQAAGAEYCLSVLNRAVDDGDPAVALGAIAALRKIGGPASITPNDEGELPLAEALSFPDRMVRIQAALALGNARPEAQFQNYQNLMPVLAEALTLFGGTRTALVVDPSNEVANELGGALRADGYEVITSADLYAGLQQIRDNYAALDLIVLSSDISNPNLTAALRELRQEFRFAYTPTLILTKPADREAAEQLASGDFRTLTIPGRPTAEGLSAAIRQVSRSVGLTPITPELGLDLALQAASTLNLLAMTNNPLFDASKVEAALIGALGAADPALRLTVADVLGFICTSTAQQAIAGVALSASQDETLRVEMFSALAEAAKRCGNQLDDRTVQTLMDMAENEANMTLREAASRALGALNLPSNPASQIIRNTYAG